MHCHSIVSTIITSLVVAFANVALADSTLQVSWPAGWEYRPAKQSGPAIHFDARQQLENRTVQHLSVTMVDITTSAPRVTRDSLKQLAARLRDTLSVSTKETDVPLHSFSSADGYYFAATDWKHDGTGPRDFKQLIEGVLMRDGYLINFTLLTPDHASPASREMLHALAHMRVVTENQPLLRSETNRP